ncbi:SDR family oxidoreductase [Hephaestia mangrovi]|uniref:SDR family oxidoreductase n=1 Tax=Hephaestia mangrovi TaxID=2873268 RepID=UPI001CA6FC1C|nr:SDR family oxidoreductase [Hephaestia mangrovi]
MNEGRKRTVLVTGGAKRVGAAIVRHLAAQGHRVVIHYGNSQLEAARLAAETGGVAIGADLADQSAVTNLIGESAELAGAPIDGLVNSASLFEFDRPPLDDWALLERLMPVNLGAPVLLASALARQPGLADGAVVNLLDQKVANLNPDFFSYTCTKVALAGATEMLARALAPAVRVNAVAPGLTLPSGDQSAEEFAQVSRENLLRRQVDIEEIARAVDLLLTSTSITGQTMFVDCGQRFLPRDGDVMFEMRARP